MKWTEIDTYDGGTDEVNICMKAEIGDIGARCQTAISVTAFESNVQLHKCLFLY